MPRAQTRVRGVSTFEVHMHDTPVFLIGISKMLKKRSVTKEYFVEANSMVIIAMWCEVRLLRIWLCLLVGSIENVLGNKRTSKVSFVS